MTDTNQKLREALQALLASGGVIAEATADELQAAIDDPDAEEIVKVQAAAVLNARQDLATTEPEPKGMPELPPVAHIELGDDSHDVVTLEAAKAYGEQCWKAGYKHGAWGTDTKDAERYRWLRDDTDSDWAICEWSHDPGDEGYYRDARAPHIVDAAIDAAMAQGVK